MSCQETHERLPEWLAGQLASAEAATLEYHIEICKNYLRDADRARQKLENYVEVRSLRQAEEAANTSAEEFDALRGVIDRLHTRQRETLLLRVVEDLSFNEIAEVMQCSEGTAKSNYHHAVKNLRSMVLAEEGQIL